MVTAVNYTLCVINVKIIPATQHGSTRAKFTTTYGSKYYYMPHTDDTYESILGLLPQYLAYIHGLNNRWGMDLSYWGNTEDYLLGKLHDGTYIFIKYK